MRISDWSSDVCSSDLRFAPPILRWLLGVILPTTGLWERPWPRWLSGRSIAAIAAPTRALADQGSFQMRCQVACHTGPKSRCRSSCRGGETACQPSPRSEEHTSELQSLMRISYAVFCLKKKTTYTTQNNNQENTCQRRKTTKTIT